MRTPPKHNYKPTGRWHQCRSKAARYSAYAVSKAAAFNLTQSLRGLLAPRGVSVHAILTGPTDTDMTRAYEIPKATPESVAQGILDGLEAGEEEIFPDPLSAQLAVGWRHGAAKAFEHQFALAVAA